MKRELKMLILAAALGPTLSGCHMIGMAGLMHGHGSSDSGRSSDSHDQHGGKDDRATRDKPAGPEAGGAEGERPAGETKRGPEKEHQEGHR
jgi:predicted small lipoprotein YifL